MAWVRFPDGSRRKVERASRTEAENDLNELLARRAAEGAPVPRRERLATFNELIDDWLDAGCPAGKPGPRARHVKSRSVNTIANARHLLDGHVRPDIGPLWVDRTQSARLEKAFLQMADLGYATSTIDHTWGYLNQACSYGQRLGRVKTNPAEEVLLPECRPAKLRKSLTVVQAERLLLEAIPRDPNPAMWLTALMCGLRPGELAGLRWPNVDIDSDDPSLDIVERLVEVNHRFAGLAPPKTPRSVRRLGLHPLLVAALRRHREEMRLLGLYDEEGFVFGTRTGTPFLLGNLRAHLRRLCRRAGLGTEWTTYELRHSFVSLVADQLDDIVKVADLAGHVDTRTTHGYRHPVRPSLGHAIAAWDVLLGSQSEQLANEMVGSVPAPPTVEGVDT
jgi:integrase